MDKNVNIITDLDGRKIVLINDIRFRSRRGIERCKYESQSKHYSRNR